MKRKTAKIALFVVVLLLSLLSPSSITQTRSANFALRWDADSTTLTYCRLVGRNNDPFGGAMQGNARVKTTGSSVDITAVTAGQAPFTLLAEGDVIEVRNASGTVGGFRTITAKTDADNIEVDTAINLDTTTGFQFGWFDLQCGTTDADGWIDTSGLQSRVAAFQLEQVSGVTGGIDVRWECKGEAAGSLPTIIHPGASTADPNICQPGTLASAFCNFTTAGITTGRMWLNVDSEIPCQKLRVGVKINTSDGAEAAEADRERITIYLEESKGT